MLGNDDTRYIRSMYCSTITLPHCTTTEPVGIRRISNISYLMLINS